MSAPAANTFSPPYRITARTWWSVASCEAAPAISVCTWAFSAFIFGRLSRTTATAASISTWTNSPIRTSLTGPILCRTRGSYAGQGPRRAPAGTLPRKSGSQSRSGRCCAQAALLAGGVRHGRPLPPVEEAADFTLAVAAVPAGGPDRRQLAAPGPPGHGLGIHPQQGRYLGRGQQAVLRLDLGSHEQRPFTRGSKGPDAESSQAQPSLSESGLSQDVMPRWLYAGILTGPGRISPYPPALSCKADATLTQPVYR